MKSKLTKEQKGFTIIEVLIVLAIAGLIMLIVFLAVPALQRNSRNTQRTADAAKVSAAVAECMGNRNGQTASCDANPTTELSVDMTKLSQITSIAPWSSADWNAVVAGTQVLVLGGHKCTDDGSWVTTTGATPRQFIVEYVNENNVARCIDV